MSSGQGEGEKIREEEKCMVATRTEGRNFERDESGRKGQSRSVCCLSHPAPPPVQRCPFLMDESHVLFTVADDMTECLVYRGRDIYWVKGSVPVLF